MKYQVTEIVGVRLEEVKSEHPNLQEAITAMVNWQYHNPGHSYNIKRI